MPATPPPSLKGRGARSNATGRYEKQVRETFDDGWEPSEPDQPPTPLKTELQPDRSRTIIARNDSPDIGFERSINPYRGCEHGCTYCYARPGHAYLGLSPGLDFETRLFFKADAPRLLQKELSRKGYRPERIHIGGVTDPYQPIERKLKITRQVLEVLERFNHPFSIITKSDLVTRDVDIIGRMAARDLAGTYISVTTLDRSLARAMEPRAATPARRIAAIRALAEAGVPVGVGFAPVIPGLNDHELEAVLEAAAEAGARSAMYVTLRLPLEIKDLFQEWLAEARPDRAARVMSLIRQSRGGKDYDAQWGSRMKGTGPVADLVGARFAAACKRLGLNREPRTVDLTQFRVPGAFSAQMDLFA
ncbi:PA0069 family radical SAM protein [Brevundimonas sp. 2R-24]|uniref:PA0069 family radical SAM protein n=1 Tax=Peiella sedimenti TaxID=3061083 RepID=A0ABT8SRQ6_9CAUL|nr:PA0069 family radical SAM protein [Caulobacteraceae bacterium XZ-24]